MLKGVTLFIEADTDFMHCLLTTFRWSIKYRKCTFKNEARMFIMPTDDYI